MRASSFVIFALLVSLAAACAEQPEDARGLQSRLLAPCCYKQTLDVHASELAVSVRARIERRMSEGASAAQVESELIAQYGERIRALPNRHFLDRFGWLGMFGMGAALVVLLGVGWRLRRRTVPTATPPPPLSSAQRAQLDEELLALD